jgi:hypothetical protein
MKDTHEICWHMKFDGSVLRIYSLCEALWFKNYVYAYDARICLMAFTSLRSILDESQNI